GLIDAEATYTELAKADLVILSVPVDAAAKLLPEILDHIADHTLVLDMGSTKQNICQTVKTHKNRRNFLAVHPIAGTEFSGPKAATDNLFKNKTIIICEVENTAFKLQEKALQLFAQLGMRIRYMNPRSEEH